MKYNFRNIVFVFSIVVTSIFVTAKSYSQTLAEPFVVPGSQVYKVYSEHVQQLYELRVSVPGEYQANPDKAYPVIYVLDGQWNFTIVSDIVGKLAYDGMIPQAIVVAITWGAEGDDPGALRVRDFLPTANAGLPLSGGAERFLMAIEDELLPFVDAEYRTSDTRMLIGSSFGGIFSSYAMFKAPHLFSGTIATAAPYAVEEALFTSELEQFESRRGFKGKRAYVAVGALDLNKPGVKIFARELRRNKPKRFKTKLEVVSGMGHAGVEPIAYAKGLQYVFKRPKLGLSKEFLMRYEGLYTLEDIPGFPSFDVESKKGRLEITQEGQDPLAFYPETKTDFYFEGVDINATFVKKDDGTMSMHLYFQGNVFELIRQ